MGSYGNTQYDRPDTPHNKHVLDFCAFESDAGFLLNKIFVSVLLCVFAHRDVAAEIQDWKK